jgi:hypothetical protein
MIGSPWGIVDSALLSDPDASEIGALQTELETIVRAANIVPMRSSELFFELKSHIDHTRSNLASGTEADIALQSKCLV